MFDSILNNPFCFNGFKVYETPLPQQKIRLSSSVNVSDSFRQEFDIWLADEFGYKDPLLKPDQVLISQQFGMMIMDPRQIAILSTVA